MNYPIELPRLEMGQGITTAVALLVAEELDADYERNDVVLSDRRPDRAKTHSGVAVIAQTFHHAIKARDALVIQWAPAPAAGRSDEDMRAELKATSSCLERV